MAEVTTTTQAGNSASSNAGPGARGGRRTDQRRGQGQGQGQGQGNRRGRGDSRGGRDRDDDGFEQKIVHLARVTRVMAGGKRMRFRACVAVGNKAGKVGIGVAKSIDVTTAIAKAAEQAKRNAITIQVKNGTITHPLKHKYGAARIFMKPAPVGRGIIAGGAMRVVLELAGIHNIVGKIQGSKNKVNIVRCVIEALKHMKHVEAETPKRTTEGEQSAAGKSANRRGPKREKEKVQA